MRIKSSMCVHNRIVSIGNFFLNAWTVVKKTRFKGFSIVMYIENQDFFSKTLVIKLLDFPFSIVKLQ